MENMSIEEIREYRSLLTKTKEGQLLMEGQNLEEIANMYHLSIVDFFKILPIYFEYRNITDFKIVTTQMGVGRPTNEFFATPEEYEALRRHIFEIAFIRCSDIGDRSYNTVCEASGVSLSRALKISDDLAKEEIYHAIYRSALGGYDIKNTGRKVDKNNLMEQYSSFGMR